jgi:hypothetical protein
MLPVFFSLTGEENAGNMHSVDNAQLTNSEVLDHVAEHHLCDWVGL